ncbi:MAG: hypothetical protein PHP26_09680 [Syntrophomonas sp.]|nr:hypothetical protein [Syntrophomonas sp.]
MTSLEIFLPILNLNDIPLRLAGIYHIQSTDVKSLYQQTGDSIILLDLALLFMQIGEPDRAELLLEQIDWNQIPADMRQQIFGRFAETDAELMFQFNMIDTLEGMREKIEEKNILIDASLKKGIKNMPVEWIDAACSRYDL